MSYSPEDFTKKPINSLQEVDTISNTTRGGYQLTTEPVMLYFCGFNGFGQFGKAHASRVPRVTKFDNHPRGDFLIRPAWSCNVIAVGNEVFLSGFVHNTGREVEKLCFPDRIVDVCATDKYCLVLLECGKLFKLRRNDLEIQEVRFADVDAVPVTRKQKIFETTGDVSAEASSAPRIVHIACGNNLAVAVSTGNVVYNIPTRIHQFPMHERVVSLQCGFEHAVALNANGDVYTWGNGLRGQLGIEDLRVQETPVLVEALAGIKIVSIAAGGWHSAAVSSFGDLYTWGFNCNGQLGIEVFKSTGAKNPTVYPLPQLIDLPQCPECASSSSNTEEKSCNATGVHCGARHTIVRTSCGSILAAGWNSYGQLALANDGNMVDEFRQIQDMPAGPTDIICGPWSTVFRLKTDLK